MSYESQAPSTLKRYLASDKKTVTLLFEHPTKQRKDPVLLQKSRDGTYSEKFSLLNAQTTPESELWSTKLHH
jgi:hypothetical protein